MTQNHWRNRIIKSDLVDPHTLLENPANWRTHPDHQKSMLLDVLQSIGWVDEVIATEDNVIVDGHLRVWLAREQGEAVIPVTYVNLSPDERDLALSIFDAITDMAQTDEDALAELKTRLAEARSAVIGMLDNIEQARVQTQVKVTDHKPDRAQGGNTMLRIGTQTVPIPRDVYLKWREKMYQTVSLDRKAIVEEIKRRLGL